MDSIGDRLKAARIAAGFDTAAAAAEAFNWHKQNVRDHEANRRGIDPDQADRYGRAYRVDPAWIMFGGPTRRPRPTGLVPIIGHVGADPSGRVQFARGQAGGDQAPIPPGGSPRAAALEVRGHSMPGVAEDGALIYFEEQVAQPNPDHIGRTVICETEDDEVLVKRLQRGSAPGLWNLESLIGDLRRDVTLRWVAHITAVIPPPMSQAVIVRAYTGPV